MSDGEYHVVVVVVVAAAADVAVAVENAVVAAVVVSHQFLPLVLHLLLLSHNHQL